MPRNTIIFGNGLGLALNPTFFSLEAGLDAVWDGTEHLTEDQKQLVCTAIPGIDEGTPPRHERQLNKLQVALIAAQFLSTFSTEEASWLTDSAKQLPQVFRKFIHEVGLYFHRSELELPEGFINPLAEYIDDTASHVATVNYDNLLYDGLKNKEVLSGYSGTLIDGFTRNRGFQPRNLVRRNSERKGWYLHLHGSPLYIGNRKLMGPDRDQAVATEKGHIVLTHVEHKPLIIGASPILTEYWKRFDRALQEAESIVIVGYSGLDTHLNEKVSMRCADKRIVIIEWEGVTCPT